MRRYRPDGDVYEPDIYQDVREFFANNNGAYTRTCSQATSGYAALTTGPCLGSAFVKDLAGTAKWFAGAAGKMYQASGAGAWTDRSGGITFSATSWDIITFGDYTIAAAGESTRKLQVATTGNLADIAGAPVGCSIVFNHANAVVALGPNASWARSVSGDHTNWTPVASNDADAGTLYGGVGGPITAGGVFGTLAVAWKMNYMYVGVYVGNADPDADVIRWSPVPNSGGCVGKDAWVETDVGLVYVSARDIMLFNNGKPISIADGVRKKFVRDAAANRTRIFCSLDEVNNQVYFWVSPSGSNWCSEAFTWNYKNYQQGNPVQWGRLFSLNDNSGLSLGNARVPVKNANYQDYLALGGTSNTAEVCNLAFDNVQHRAFNLAGVTYATGNALLRTGLVGDPLTDSTIHRVYGFSDSGVVFGTAPTLDVFKYPVNLGANTSESVLSMTSGCYWDVTPATARWFELRANFPAAEGQVSVSRINAEYTKAQHERGRAIA